ncbi:hypothetical protein LM602_01665 [Candidatus Acetothermia bacterium]|jgi:hypothetical protein|nr:hypothetical protein [Candidatus Acetothermia bacterium]MCI2431252.1 hypothetical protein [Candidatus Acetothermia bacterium]MCI2436291.1 hypothetical protein [Candidatus Acetothermia bacterium]
MRRLFRCGYSVLTALGLVLWGVVALANPIVEGDWVRYETERFFVYLWKETPLERLGLGSPDPLRAKLEEIALSLENDLKGIEAASQLPYDAALHGKIAIFVYASLEEYQRRTGCYLCSGHVTAVPNTPEIQALFATGRLNRYAVYVHLDNTPRGLGGLSIGLPQEVVPHELVHVLDLTLIGGSKPGTLREGLAVYATFKADATPDELQFGLTNQHLRLFAETDTPDLLSYLTGCSSRRFLYSFGGSFIDFFARKAGIGAFLDFYRRLQGERLTLPNCSFGFSLEQIDRLFRQTLQQSLDQVRQEYHAYLRTIELTEDGQFSYDFVMDQIFNRAIYLEPLLIEGAELVRLTRAVWAGGRFDKAKASYVREYILNARNYAVSAERVANAVKNFARVRSFVSNYMDDPATRSQVEQRLRELEELAKTERFEEFNDGFVALVFQYVTWRR